MSDYDAFFSGLGEHLRGKYAFGKKTANGRNLYVVGKPVIEVTANIATTNDDRVSVKLTINRGKQDGPTPVFDELERRHKGREGLDGKVDWKRESGRKESRLEVRRPHSGTSDSNHYQWIEHQADVLRNLADEGASLQ